MGTKLDLVRFSTCSAKSSNSDALGLEFAGARTRSHPGQDPTACERVEPPFLRNVREAELACHGRLHGPPHANAGSLQTGSGYPDTEREAKAKGEAERPLSSHVINGYESRYPCSAFSLVFLDRSVYWSVSFVWLLY